MLNFDIKESERMKSNAGEACKRAGKNMMSAFRKLLRKVQRYEDDELPQLDTSLCELNRDFANNYAVYELHNRNLYMMSTCSSYCYDECQVPLFDDLEDELALLYETGRKLCDWRNSILEEDEPDEVSRAQLAIINKLIDTLNNTLKMLSGCGYGDLPLINLPLPTSTPIVMQQQITVYGTVNIQGPTNITNFNENK